jgi:hypothetical protein
MTMDLPLYTASDDVFRLGRNIVLTKRSILRQGARQMGLPGGHKIKDEGFRGTRQRQLPDSSLGRLEFLLQHF